MWPDRLQFSVHRREDPLPVRVVDRGRWIEILPPGDGFRRSVLFVPFVGGAGRLRSWLGGRFLGHSNWGAIELARLGYRVFLPCEPSFGSGLARAASQDLLSLRPWLTQIGDGDIVYSNHNAMLLYPLLRSLRRRVKIVGYLYAREPLPLARMYDGIACLTDAAVEHGRKKAPRAVVEKIGWGVECTAHHHHVSPYQPRHVLSVGVTGRDYAVIDRGLRDLSVPVVVCARGREVLRPGGAIHVESNLIPENIAAMFRQAAVVLVTLQRDDHQREGLGYTNVIEAMAFGRPIITTRTGATHPELDAEALQIGLSVPPGDAPALRRAVQRLLDNPVEAAAMGTRAREWCQRHYNIEGYATRLHHLFNRL